MRFALAFCLLALLAAACLTSGDSSIREKRFFKKIFKGIKKAVDKTSNFVKNTAENVKDITHTAVGASTKFVGNRVKDVKKGVTGVAKKVFGITKTIVKKTGDIAKDGVEFVVDKADDVTGTVTDVAKVTVKISKKVGKTVTNVGKDVLDKADDILDTSVDFIVDVADEVKDGAVDAARFTKKISVTVGLGVAAMASDVYKGAYEAARQTFDQIKQVVGQVDFDSAVLFMVSVMGSELGNAVCQVSCVGVAAYFLGPWAILAEIICAPVCVAVTAKLNDIAENLALKMAEKDAAYIDDGTLALLA